MDNILEIRDVTKVYGTQRALDGVSLDVPRGSIYGLLGPNGAGKTTLLRIVNHITAPDSGTVFFNGKPLTADDVATIGYLPEERGLYKKMKVGEQAIFFARLKGLSRRDATRVLREWFERFGILDWWNRKVEELSKGMAQKVQFIVTVLHHPQLLIFDEPFSGFDPINANLLKEEILRLAAEGTSVIFSTHNMASVEEICRDITLLNQGRNVLSGNVEELRRRYFEHCYDISYRGSEEAMTAALATLGITDITAAPPSEDARNIIVRLPGDVTTAALIDAANRAVDLRSFGPSMASMNQIFIRTVESTR